MELPTEKRPIKSVNPGSLLIYGKPKSGKTEIVSGLDDTLIIELENKGADYIEGIIQEIHKPSELESLMKAIESKNAEIDGYVYKRIVIDTVTKLDEWSEIIGTYKYMNKTQGKKFNVVGGARLTHLDDRFETVHEIPNGYGYKHSREVMLKWCDRLMALAPEVIFIAHIKDVMIESKSGDTVVAKEMNLTGKVSTTLSSRVSAIGYFHRKGNDGIITFSADENATCDSGGRCPHLEGDIVISTKLENGKVEKYWEKIYIGK